MKIYLPSLYLERAKEFEFLDLVRQHREIHYNRVLASLAYQKAKDMAQHNYFGHYSVRLGWPNAWVQTKGFVPDYPPNGNGVESIVAGSESPSACFNALVNSESHRPHILGEGYFANHTQIGIGFFSNSESRYKFYWCILTIP